MKRYLIVVFLILIGGGQIEFDSYSKTGHDQLMELDFVNPHYELLIEMADWYIRDRLAELPVKFWGTATKTRYEYEDGTYVGNVIFSRSNKSSEKYEFDYALTEVQYFSQSVHIDGSLNIKAAGKIKKVETSGVFQISGGVDTTKRYEKTEKSTMKIVVQPNKKMTLRVAGEAKISSGFSKYYVFWICFKKGGWEMVDIVTSYFELVEENA
ncbi:MAG: hypothetical protein PHP41_03875 [Bacilli bacterium]|jgi:hypothetical protein|nr:hypothetical protein [Bacilli bacterium]MDY0063451.1 hypothetical protein [Bacilli bacterium]